MNQQRYAFCIVFNETSAADIVNATLKHDVMLVGTEPFDPEKNYQEYYQYYLEKGGALFPLFLFPSGSILALDSSSLQLALQKIEAQYKN